MNDRRPSGYNVILDAEAVRSDASLTNALRYIRDTHLEIVSGTWSLIYRFSRHGYFPAKKESCNNPISLVLGAFGTFSPLSRKDLPPYCVEDIEIIVGHENGDLAVQNCRHFRSMASSGAATKSKNQMYLSRCSANSLSSQHCWMRLLFA